MSLEKLKKEEIDKLKSGNTLGIRIDKYDVSSADIRFCESRGVKPVVFFAFTQIDVDEDDERNVREIFDDPRYSYLEKVRLVLIELRISQKVIFPNAFLTYLKYLEKIKSQDLSRLLSDL